MACDGVRLLLGDCLDLIRTIPNGSITHVVTDPPYGQFNESYDRGVDPALWRECYRVTGPDAALVSFAGGPTYHRIASDIEAAGWKVRQMWGWVYRDGMITSAHPKDGFDRLAPAMDPICYATKGKVLLRLEREGADWHKLKADGTPRGRGTPGYSARHTSDGAVKADGHWPKTLASDGVVPFEYFAYRRAQRDPVATGHPNQKPLAVMRWIVSKLPRPARAPCPECDGKGRPGWPASVVASRCLDCDGTGLRSPRPGVILDPYVGSASTLVAAIAEGFDAVGFERSPEFHALASARLAAERDRIALFADA